MSFAAVKPYFVARGKAVGLKEHTDGFNEENIASTVLDLAFHVNLGSFSGRALNQHTQPVDCPVTVTFWVKGYRTPSDAIDKAVQKGEDLAKEVLKNSNRLGTLIKNVVFNTMATEPMDLSNDNAVKVTMTFTAFVELGIV